MSTPAPMRVAILLSTFNGARFLGPQLHSLLGQTHRDWVLYWRDDGSTDDTVPLMRRFLATLSPQDLEAMQEFAAQERLKVLDVVEASGDCTPQDWLTSGSSMDLDDDEKASRK